MSGILKLFTGGDDMFTAEVYFVNMREFTDMKWGTPQPIAFRASDLGLVRLRAFGQYSMQIADPKLFVCLLYTSDAADDLLCLDHGGRRIIKHIKPNAKSINFMFCITLLPLHVTI